MPPRPTCFASLGGSLAAFVAMAALGGCGGAAPRAKTAAPQGPDRAVPMEQMRITAKRTESGGYEIEAYDARQLFERANEHLHAGRHEQATPLYDRLVEEMPSSAFASPALYNAGLCFMELEELGEATTRFERILEDYPESEDVKHATFQLAGLYVELERWDEAIEAADTLLTREDLDPDERVEAMARRSQGLLGQDKLDEAEKQARDALSYARIRARRPEKPQVYDTEFLAIANYVYAETLRLRAAAIDVPEGRVAEQRATLERRARLLLDAQREYFDTIEKTDARWAAASGYRIGEMYDAFWHAIMGAPVPPPKEPMPEDHLPMYREEYRKNLARLVKPLVRHSIRYWELTLMMVERTGVDTPWRAKIEEDLERARERLLEQPEGRGGLPAAQAEAPKQDGAAEGASSP